MTQAVAWLQVPRTQSSGGIVELQKLPANPIGLDNSLTRCILLNLPVILCYVIFHTDMAIKFTKAQLCVGTISQIACNKEYYLCGELHGYNYENVCNIWVLPLYYKDLICCDIPLEAIRPLSHKVISPIPKVY